jgi:hypothetical protein
VSTRDERRLSSDVTSRVSLLYKSTRHLALKCSCVCRYDYADDGGGNGWPKTVAVHSSAGRLEIDWRSSRA